MTSHGWRNFVNYKLYYLLLWKQRICWEHKACNKHCAPLLQWAWVSDFQIQSFSTGLIREAIASSPNTPYSMSLSFGFSSSILLFWFDPGSHGIVSYFTGLHWCKATIIWNNNANLSYIITSSGKASNALHAELLGLWFLP